MSLDLLSDSMLCFCEDAATGDDGKLNIQAIYNELYAPGFPAKQDRVVLAGIFEWNRTVDGAQPFKVRIIDPQGKTIFTIEGQTEVDERSEGRAPAKTHLVFPLENLVFMSAGQYQVMVELKDQEIKGPSLYVLKSGNEE